MGTEATAGQTSAGPVDAQPVVGEQVNASVSDIANTLAAERPEVQQHVVDAAMSKANAETTAAAQNADAAGTIFDAAKHTGTKTSKGIWRAKKQTGVAPTSTASKLGTSATSATSSPGAVSASKEAQARQGGKGAANLLIALSVGVGGPEWQPRRIVAEDRKTVLLDEKEMLESAFGDYFVATGKADLPPGWALAACMAMYSVPRFQMPVTQSRLQRVKNWIGSKILAFRAKKAGLRIPRQTQQSEQQNERSE